MIWVPISEKFNTWNTSLTLRESYKQIYAFSTVLMNNENKVFTDFLIQILIRNYLLKSYQIPDTMFWWTSCQILHK